MPEKKRDLYVALMLKKRRRARARSAYARQVCGR